MYNGKRRYPHALTGIGDIAISVCVNVTPPWFSRHQARGAKLAHHGGGPVYSTPVPAAHHQDTDPGIPTVGHGDRGRTDMHRLVMPANAGSTPADRTNQDQEVTMQELARITITQSLDDDGELDFDVQVSDGTEFIRAMGMLETAKLGLYDELSKAADGVD